MLVTGGAGFIGGSFIFFERARHPQTEPICVDKLTYAGGGGKNMTTLAPVLNDPKFRSIRADIADSDAMEAMLTEEEPDVAVSFAAESHVDRSRCSNNYGLYRFPEKLIPLMIANALADKPLPVCGQGLNVRGWLPRTRLAEGIVKTVRRHLCNRGWWEEILSGGVVDGL